MTFDKQKYFNECLQQLTKDVNDLEQLGNDWSKIKPIVDQCFEWYEEGNLALYSIFENSCGSTNSFHFFGNLHSFLVNVLLDDSQFRIVWDKEPRLLWASHNDEDSCTDAGEIIKLFNWYKANDLRRHNLEAEKIKLLNELADRIEKGKIND